MPSTSLWVELHTDLFERQETKRYAKANGLPLVHAVGHLVALWLHVAEARPNGQIGDYTPEELAEAARFDGPAGVFAKSLRDQEFIDQDGTLHNWDCYFGRWLKQRENNRERQAAWRDRERGRANGSVTVTDEPLHNGKVTVTADSDSGAQDEPNASVTVMGPQPNADITVTEAGRNGHVTVTHNAPVTVTEVPELSPKPRNRYVTTPPNSDVTREITGEDRREEEITGEDRRRPELPPRASARTHEDDKPHGKAEPRNRSREFMDEVVRMGEAQPTMRAQDHKELKESAADPITLAHLWVAASRGEWDPDKGWLRRNLSVHQAIGKINAFRTWESRRQASGEFDRSMLNHLDKTKERPFQTETKPATLPPAKSPVADSGEPELKVTDPEVEEESVAF